MSLSARQKTNALPCREQTIDARPLLSLMHKTNRFLHSLELDKLLSDGPELLGMVSIQRIGQIAGKG